MFKKITFFGLLLAVCVVVMGAYLRLSQAGLGCPDWPLCYGQVIVQVPSPGEILPQFPGTPPFEAVKAWKAVTHRYLAAGLGLVALVLAGMVFGLKKRRGKALALTYGFLLLLLGQVTLGYLTVHLKLMPVVVSAHLMLGLLSLGLLYGLHFTVTDRPAPLAKTPVLRWLSGLGLLLLFLQLFTGGWVSSHHAGLTCPDFPTCLGSAWPEADYSEGFRLWRGLDGVESSGPLSTAAKVAIHWVHRLGSIPTFLVLSLLAMASSSNRRIPGLSKPGLLLSTLLLAEISLGVGGIFLQLPIALALAHSAVAVLLWLNVIHIFLYVRVPFQAKEERPVIEGTAVELPIETAPLAVPGAVVIPPSGDGLLIRLKGQLGKTRSGVTGFLSNLVAGKQTVDADLLEEVETQLIMADVGVTVTREILQHLKDSAANHQSGDMRTLEQRIRDYLQSVLAPVSSPLEIPPETRPFVILVVGVNGVGKTTTIGKLAKRLQMQGHSVMLAAGDTFRAAAVEQLQTWGERNQVPVIAQHSGADSASVIYDAVQAAQARGVDVLIADTAGRLHTKSNLMEELAKIRRVIGRLDATAPHEVLLVLDASTGQNALSQARQFNEAVSLTGIALTKLDGTAKGGVIFALAQQFGIPIRFIGIGETIDDLQDFEAGRFIDALFADQAD